MFSLLQRYEQGEEINVSDIRILVFALPRGNEYPIVKRVTPEVIEFSQERQTVKLMGHFPQIAQGQEVVLEIGNKTIRPKKATELDLEFELNKRDFPPGSDLKVL